MGYVKKNLIDRGMEDFMQGNGELDYTQVWSDVTAGLTEFLNQTLPDFLRKGSEFFRGQIVQVVRAIYFV